VYQKVIGNRVRPVIDLAFTALTVSAYVVTGHFYFLTCTKLFYLMLLFFMFKQKYSAHHL